MSQGGTHRLYTVSQWNARYLLSKPASPLFGEPSTVPVFGEPSTVSGSFFQWYKVSPCVCQAPTAATAAMTMVACPKLLVLLVVCTALLQHGDSRPSRSRKAAPGRRRGNTHHTVEVGQMHCIEDRCVHLHRTCFKAVVMLSRTLCFMLWRSKWQLGKHPVTLPENLIQFQVQHEFSAFCCFIFFSLSVLPEIQLMKRI